MTGSTDFPLSFAQQRIWFLDELRARDHGMSDYRVFRVAGRLDLGALRAALARLVARHEPLRTTYHLDAAGGLIQRVADAGGIPLTVLDVPSESAALAEAAVWAQVRFPLDTGPLAAVTVLRVDDGLCVLVLTFHLLVMDAWGLAVWCRDLGGYYAELATGTPAALPALPVQYADWAVWARDRLTVDRQRELVSWWRRSLSGFPRLIGLPTVRGSRVNPGPVGRRRHRPVPPQLASDVGRLARAEGTTTHAILATAYAIALWAHTGQSRLLIATPVANRDHPEVQDLLGFFVDTVAVPVDLTGRPSGRALWRRLAAATRAAYAHRELPFDRLVSALAEGRVDGRFPLAQAGFVHRPAGSLGELRLAGCEVADEPVDIDRTRFEFTVRVDEVPSGSVVTAEFDATLFAADYVDRFLDDYLATLARLVADPAAPVRGSATPCPAPVPAVVGEDSIAVLTRLVRLRGSGHRVALEQLYQRQD